MNTVLQISRLFKEFKTLSQPLRSFFKWSAKNLPLITAVNHEISKRYLEVYREKNIEQELR